MGTDFSFEVVSADDYDALRPDYAAKAAAWVAERGGLGAGSLVVDLAAGTGQLCRRFAPLGVDLVAIEPARNMRTVIEERLPGVRALDGTAESIPLGDGGADAVVVGNAFHHFDSGLAFAEIRRVLRPGGVLALFWARSGECEDERHPLIREIDAVAERVRVTSPIASAYRGWYDTPGAVAGFTAFERRSFPTVHALPSDRLGDLFATSSDIAALPPTKRASLIRRIRELARGLPEILELPARSEVDLCLRETKGAR